MKNTFRKYERLCNKSAIDNLFKKGHLVYCFPLAIRWTLVSMPMEQTPCQVLLIAPKKLFKRATERNKRKRILKESFRQQKHPLYTFLNENEIQMHLAISFTKEQEITKDQLDAILESGFDKLIKKIANQIGKQ
ncbi:ribonuclease P protein component [Bacteroidales bacterium OttesenSCG-928-C19]|nr:ribonuclease P protein component [Bacteroidales bacterium OttesenSCG-928-C19]